MNQLITSSTPMTMSSREIAELCDKRHDNVKRTIEALLNQGVIVRPQIEDESGADAMGRQRITQVYVFTGERGKRDCIIVVAQLCPEFTARIVDRWQELEQQMVVPALPNFQDPAAAARAWAEQFDKRTIAEQQKALLEHKVAEQSPKVEALERISASKSTLTMTQAAKVLSIKRDTLTSRLQMEGWIYRQNGSWLAYDKHLKNGNLSYKEANYTDEKTGMSCIKPYCHITHKGLTRLALILGTTPPANGFNAKDFA